MGCSSLLPDACAYHNWMSEVEVLFGEAAVWERGERVESATEKKKRKGIGGVEVKNKGWAFPKRKPDVYDSV